MKDANNIPNSELTFDDAKVPVLAQSVPRDANKISDSDLTFDSPEPQSSIYLQKTGETVTGPASMLQNMGRIASTAFDTGNASIEKSQVLWKQLMGDNSPELDSKISKLNEQIKTDPQTNSLPQEVVGATSEQLPMLGHIIGNATVRGAEGAALFGAGAMAFNAIAAPETAGLSEVAAPVTVPAAAAIGGKLGVKFGAGEAIYMTEAASIYEQTKDLKDTNGNPINPTAARMAAFLGAIPATGAQMLPVGEMMKLIPGSGVVLDKIGATVEDSIKAPVGGQAIKNFALEVSKLIGAMEVGSVGAAASETGAVEALKHIETARTDQQFQTASASDVVNHLVDVAQETLKSSPILAVGFALPHLVSDIRGARSAVADAKVDSMPIDIEAKTPQVKEVVDNANQTIHEANDKIDAIDESIATAEPEAVSGLESQKKDFEQQKAEVLTQADKQLGQLEDGSKSFLDLHLEKIQNEMDAEKAKQLDNVRSEVADTGMTMLRKIEDLKQNVQDVNPEVSQLLDQTAQALKEKRNTGKPQSLTEFIQENGGVKDEGGDMRAIGVSKRQRSIISDKGRSLDEMGRAAYEAGFFKERPTHEEFLTKFEQDFKGDKVFSEADIGKAEKLQHLNSLLGNLDQALGEHGITFDRQLLKDFRGKISENAKLEKERAKIEGTAVKKFESLTKLEKKISDSPGTVFADKLKTTMDGIKLGKTFAKAEADRVQSRIVDLLDESGLKANDKAKFIRAVKNIQTIADFKKAAPDLEKRVESLLDAGAKREVKAELKGLIKSAKKSGDIAVDSVAKLKEMQAKFKDSGILGAGFKETSLKDFQSALDDAKNIIAEGRKQLSDIRAAKEKVKVERLATLQKDTVPLSNVDIKKAGLNEKLSVMDKFKNTYIEGLNKVQRLNLNKNPMDVIFDIMDGNKDYKGANSTVFKKTMDKAYHNFLQLREETTRSVKNLADKLDLNEVNYKRIGAWAALQQEGGERKLLHSGIAEKELSDLKLTPEESQMYNLMREKLDSLQPALKEVMRTVYNKDFTKVKDYFPFMTDFKAMDSMEIQNMFGEDSLLISDAPAEYNKKDVKKGFTKERVLGKQKIKIDALGVFLNHVDNATYLINMGKDIKELGELAQSDDFRKISGDLGQSIVSDWIDLLARKGKLSGQIDLLNTLRVNAGSAVLAFKLSSALVQPTALLEGAALIGGDYVLKGIRNVADDGWREFMFKNIPELRERIGDDPSYLEMGGGSTIASAREVGFWALQKLDHLSASAVVSGAYIKSIEERGGVVDLSTVDPIAVEDATLALRRSQASPFVKDAAPIISQAKLTGNISVDKLILQFQSFMLNRWSMIQHDMWNAGIKEGKTMKAVNIATWLLLANLAEIGIRHYTKELISLMTGAPINNNKQDEVTWKTYVDQALSNVPFVSPFVSSAEYGSVPVPSMSLMQSMFQELSYAGKSIDENKKLKHVGLAGLQAAGLLFGAPGTSQVGQIIQSATKAK